jgi:hypothetical protein
MSFLDELKQREEEGRKKTALNAAKKNAILYKTPTSFSVLEAGTDYSKLLQTQEWRKKRTLILKRDKYRCQTCQNEKLLKDTNCKYFFKGIQANSHSPESWKIELFDHDIVTGYYQVYFRGEFSKLPRNIKLFVKKVNARYAELIAIAKSSEQSPEEKYLSQKSLYPQNKIDLCSKILPSFNENDDFEFIYVNGLHVHHKYYILNKKPWEYSNDALITLCFHCHYDYHENHQVQVFTDELLHDFKYKPFCKKCNGSGYIPEFYYHKAGICFNCNGKGYLDKSYGS